MKPKYLDTIVKHYENCLEQHGDSHLGVDWPKAADAKKRYDVMLDVIKFSKADGPVRLLDFGCGAAHLLDHIKEQGLTNIEYAGLDISEKFIDLCKKKHPGVSFYCEDILSANHKLPAFDYIVMNGVFTEKREMSFEEMWEYFTKMLVKVFPLANKGIVFNVMSKEVEWERDDLFHVAFDKLGHFLCKELTRNFIIRNDYGLYEYTTYVYK